MKKFFIGCGVVCVVMFVVILIFAVSAIGINNSLVSSHQNVQQKYADVQVQLQRRMELIPNLVSTVKGYAAHEEKVFSDVDEALTKLSGAVKSGDIAEIQQADAGLSSVLRGLLAVQMNYPNLKADTQFTNLMDELAGTENRVSFARQEYNNAVTPYNNLVNWFPSSFVAYWRGDKPEKRFEAEEGASIAPKVEF